MAVSYDFSQANDVAAFLTGVIVFVYYLAQVVTFDAHSVIGALSFGLIAAGGILGLTGISLSTATPPASATPASVRPPGNP